ncbi:hypothetical protein CL652_01685 [bacterium]|nr:hypothetical protein [bacterium]|tara:strand:+ start:6978 stop:8057 length:1080 start_codon:yes stop_codon:yes gene_type:complete
MNAKRIQLYAGAVAILFISIALGAWYFEVDKTESLAQNPNKLRQTTAGKTIPQQTQKDGNTGPQTKTTSRKEVTLSVGSPGGVFEEVPDNEILSGGPGKDDIPSIDNPKFVSVKEASFLNDDEFGIGIVVDDVARFYPFQILVWHEIVNDSIAGMPLAVTYCPLCRTGVAYERSIGGEVVEFGVSGMLWKSNLLMYNRSEPESLWSQVLGRAVKGPLTGTRLTIYPSDTVQFGDWKRAHPNTQVLSRDTGVFRLYGTDPYGDYYTNRDVSFGVSFSDTRLHPKEYVFGIERDGKFKAYVADSLPVGTTTDLFAGATITIEKSSTGEVRMFADGEPLPIIGGFWFSWLAVHENTELFDNN